MNFGWVKAGQDGWSLHLLDGRRIVAKIGVMYPVEDGYVVFPSPSPGTNPFAPCYLPADLTLDEAKSAAKLILATGGTHGQR